MLCPNCQKIMLHVGYDTCLPCYARSDGEEISSSKSPVSIPEPTDALPGSVKKVLVLAERARRGQRLYHPLDAGIPLSTRNRLKRVIPDW